MKLEQHIRELRDRLDSDVPREGHEQRFLRKLEKQPAARVSFRHVLQIAASVAIILASAMVLVQLNRSGNRTASEEIPSSVMEADFYYATQVDQRYEQINGFDFENAEEKAVLLDELKDLDTYHQQLLRDLEANPGDERVINALIRHYQVKLEIMDQIIYQLNQLKTESDINDENENV
jgi:hypothetical protein